MEKHSELCRICAQVILSTDKSRPRNLTEGLQSKLIKYFATDIKNEPETWPKMVHDR